MSTRFDLRWVSRRLGSCVSMAALWGCASSGPVFVTKPRPPSPTAAQATFRPDEQQRIAAVQPHVRRAAAMHELDPTLINAVIWVESRFEPKAKSPAGARGLMQLMPATASSLAQRMNQRARSYDPAFNVAAGSLYLARLRDRYKGNIKYALAAYNAGAGNVDQWIENDGMLAARGRIYVQKVLDAQALFEAWTPTPSTQDRMLAKTPSPAPPPAEVMARRKPAARVEKTAPEPPKPEHEVRYDLDRVESDYQPQLAAEPPLFDTPYPPKEPVHEPESIEPEMQASDSPEVGVGVLPSVLD